MKPRGWYVVFLPLLAVTICHGHQQARALSPGRSYVRCTDKTGAEEWAAWWLYKHPDRKVVSIAEAASYASIRT